MSLFLEMVKFLAPNLNQVLEEKVPMQLHSISNCIKSKELKIEVASELRRKVVRHGCHFASKVIKGKCWQLGPIIFGRL